jgi:hypothetical protein
MTLVQELEDLRKNDIVVVMTERPNIGVLRNASRALRGHLIRFDEEVIVLGEVYESFNSQSSDGKLTWRKVLHSRVVLPSNMILRVWPWDAPKVEKKT